MQDLFFLKIPQTYATRCKTRWFYVCKTNGTMEGTAAKVNGVKVQCSDGEEGCFIGKVALHMAEKRKTETKGKKKKKKHAYVAMWGTMGGQRLQWMVLVSIGSVSVE